ncbi:MAG: hypothetical protein ACHQ52_08155 [Candidatus Eisenbacteria bacterium]
MNPSRFDPRTPRIWVMLPAFAIPLRLRDLGGWERSYAWILAAGVIGLVATWLLARLGTRRGLAAPPLLRSDESMPGDVWPDLDLRDAARNGLPPAATRTAKHARRHAAPATRPTAPPTQRRLVHERLGFAAPRRPSGTTAWLHLVSGPTPALAARAAFEVAADLIGRGGRVLMVDAGRRCMLHARLQREARWGVGECLDGTLPVLGVVQNTGFAGLHLLARGGEPALLWESLGRLADEAHALFEHVLVALDVDVPREAGMALAGRLVEGWWAGEQVPERAALALSERLGIVFSGMPLGPEAEVMLEAASAPARLAAATAEPVSAAPALTAEGAGILAWEMVMPIETASGPDWAALVRRHRDGLDPGAAEQTPDDETTVLAYDGDVRSRLEFLMWVRRVTGDAPRTPAAWEFAGVRTTG